MTDKQTKEYISIWGDTVDMKQLLFGMVGGALTGYVSFVAGQTYLIAYHPSLGKGLTSGYALLFGVVGCVLAGVVAALVISPKRVFHEEKFNVDIEAIAKELDLDLGTEAEYLKSVPADVVAEMRQLQLYDFFAGKK